MLDKTDIYIDFHGGITKNNIMYYDSFHFTMKGVGAVL